MNLNLTEEDVQSMLGRITSLENFISGLDGDALSDVIENQGQTDWLFVLICAFNVFLMQAGFALLEVGTVQAKNAKSILFKNTLDIAVSMMIWWCFGFGLAGAGASSQIGRNFFNIDDENAVSFIHSYVFAGTTATIVSGGVAERMNFTAYLLFSVFMVGFIYPPLTFWGWSSDGFLAKAGYLDFAGSGLVHLCGGLAALIGAKLVGPRLGRLKEENGKIEVLVMKGHSPVLSNFGTFILLFGWLSFNGSSVLGGSSADIVAAARAINNTLISIAGAALTSYFDNCRQQADGKAGTHDLAALNNAMLAGAVGITAGCGFVKGWAALIIGVVSYFVFKYSSLLVIAYKIDDPLETASVHGACGLWGVLAAGLFAHPDLTSGATRSSTGILLGGNGYLLGVQVLGCVFIVMWTGVLAFLCFKALDKIPGCQLRVDKDAELLGLDFVNHDGFAYPELTKDAVIHFNEVKAAEERARARNAGRPPRTKKVKSKSSSALRQMKHGGFPFSKSASICSSGTSAEAYQCRTPAAPNSSVNVSSVGKNNGCVGKAMASSRRRTYPAPGSATTPIHHGSRQQTLPMAGQAQQCAPPKRLGGGFSWVLAARKDSLAGDSVLAMETPLEKKSSGE